MLRDEEAALGLKYAMGVLQMTTVGPDGMGPALRLPDAGEIFAGASGEEGDLKGPSSGSRILVGKDDPPSVSHGPRPKTMPKRSLLGRCSA